MITIAQVSGKTSIDRYNCSCLECAWVGPFYIIRCGTLWSWPYQHTDLQLCPKDKTVSWADAQTSSLYSQHSEVFVYSLRKGNRPLPGHLPAILSNHLSVNFSWQYHTVLKRVDEATRELWRQIRRWNQSQSIIEGSLNWLAPLFDLSWWWERNSYQFIFQFSQNCLTRL